MGSTVCQAVADDPDVELVAAVDPHHAGLDLRQVTGVDLPLQITADPEGLTHDDLDVVVDFTQLAAARGNLDWLAEHGVHAVVGTSGFTDADVDGLRAAFTSSNCVIVP